MKRLKQRKFSPVKNPKAQVQILQVNESLDFFYEEDRVNLSIAQSTSDKIQMYETEISSQSFQLGQRINSCGQCQSQREIIKQKDKEIQHLRQQFQIYKQSKKNYIDSNSYNKLLRQYNYYKQFANKYSELRKSNEELKGKSRVDTLLLKNQLTKVEHFMQVKNQENNNQIQNLKRHIELITNQMNMPQFQQLYRQMLTEEIRIKDQSLVDYILMEKYSQTEHLKQQIRIQRDKLMVERQYVEKMITELLDGLEKIENCQTHKNSQAKRICQLNGRLRQKIKTFYKNEDEFQRTIAEKVESEFKEVSNILNSTKNYISQNVQKWKIKNTRDKQKLKDQVNKLKLQTNCLRAEMNCLRAEMNSREIKQKAEKQFIQQQLNEKKLRLQQQKVNSTNVEEFSKLIESQQRMVKELKALYQKAQSEKQSALQKYSAAQKEIYQLRQQIANSNLQSASHQTFLTVSSILEFRSTLRQSLIGQITTFLSKDIKKTQLVFKQDQYHYNFTPYMKQSHPLLILIKIKGVNKLCGAFTLGIEHIKASNNHSFLFCYHQKLKVFLKNDQISYVTAVKFAQNKLIFGNNQLQIIGNNLKKLFRVNLSIFGSKYYNIPNKSDFLDQEGEIQYEELELHRIYL